MAIRKNVSRISTSRLTRKADTKVVVNQTLQMEDEFGGMYDMHASNAAIMPPFNPLTLKALCSRNNILMQCVHAMENNIDGTGYEIVDDSNDGKPKKVDPKMQAALDAAQTPPTPGQAANGLPGAVDPQKLLEHLKDVIPVGASDSVQAASAAADIEASSGGKVVPLKPGKGPVAGDKATTGADPQAVDPNAAKDPQTGLPLDANADTPEEDAERRMLEAFFKEPFPNESFVGTRRKVRVDIEQTGNGYMEIIRNLNDDIVFIRHLDSATMRLVKLDNAVPVERKIERDGNSFTATIMARERRYVQRVGTNYIYYKEFGSERDINRDDGKWLNNDDNGLPASGAASGDESAIPGSMSSLVKKAAQDQMDHGDEAPKVKPKGSKATQNEVKLGSEVLHFICDKDPKTPYGIPRWINNLPAVLGSRKAEEFNLDFFDAGGLPPAIIFIQGGALASQVRTDLLAFLSGDVKKMHRAAVVEAQSSSGSLDSTGQVKVSVERFGDTRQNDSMFQNYDVKCEDHVRGAFRLPGIFLGKSSDYNFATALTAVMVTEAQVFAPERKEFDELINHTIVRALGAKKYKLKSLPITLKNADLQLKSLDIAANHIDGQDLIDTINQITGLSLSYSESAEKASNALSMAKAAQAATTAQVAGSTLGGGGGGGGGDSTTGGGGTSKGMKPVMGAGGGLGPKNGMSSVAMKEDLSSNDIVMLAGEWARAIGLSDGPRLEREVRRAVIQKVEGLPVEQRRLFNAVLAQSTFAQSSFDQEGLAELAGCCASAMQHEH